MKASMNLWKKKQPVKVKVLVDGKFHREHVRKLNIYGDGENCYARAGMHGELVQLDFWRGMFRAPSIKISSVRMISPETLTKTLAGDKS